MKLEETLSQALYKKSASPEAPENQTRHWKWGYAMGLMKIDDDDDWIGEEYREWGKDDSEGFSEYKRGRWAGRFKLLTKGEIMYATEGKYEIQKETNSNRGHTMV